MRTDTEGSPSVAEEKSSAVPHFRSGRRSPIFAELTNKGKVGVQRGRETAGVPSFLPLRRAPQSPALRRAQLPAEVQQKTPARQGRTACAVRVPRSAGAEKLPPVRGEPPARFGCPSHPVLKKLPPVRGEPAYAVRVPRSADAEKTAARQGRTACAVRVPRSAGAEKTAARQGRTACAVRVPRSIGAG